VADVSAPRFLGADADRKLDAGGADACVSLA
jgi:hypothetical protein